MNLLIFVPMTAPEVILGASMLTLWIAVGTGRGLLTILIAHIMFNISFVVVTVRARLTGLNKSLEEAGMDLYANERTTFRKITLPIIFPGILAAALLAFALSIDDYVITSFNAGHTLTFPLWVFGVSRLGIPPEVNVLGTLVFLIAFVFIAIQYWSQRRAGRNRRGGAGHHGRPLGPGPMSEEPGVWHDRRAGVPPVWARYTDLVVERGIGSWVETVDGQRYLDYTSGIGVTNTGHAHPRVAAAIAEQASKIIHAQQNILYHKPGLVLHERLPRTFPGLRDGESAGLFLSNSGAEAIEASVKLAKYATRRPRDRRLPRRLPRPHPRSDGAHQLRSQVPRPLRAAPRGSALRPVPVRAAQPNRARR